MTPPTSAPGKYRSDLILFMAIAFGVSWVCWFAAAGLGPVAPAATVPLHLLGAFGPLIGALVLRIRRTRRKESVPEHVVRFRAKTLFWAPLMLVLASATVLSAAFLAQAAGGPAVSADSGSRMMEMIGGPAVFLVNMLIGGPLPEEPGWRGTAYPRMRASMGRFQAGVVLGAIWAVWHLPLFFINGTQQNMLGLASPNGVLFAVSAIPMAMLTCYAYERAGVVASIATHFAVNLTMVTLGVGDPMTLAMIIGIQAITAALLTTNNPAPTPDRVELH